MMSKENMRVIHNENNDDDDQCMMINNRKEDDQTRMMFSTNDDQNEDNLIENNIDDQCVVRKRICQKHELPAIMKKIRRRIWTKNQKSGLYGYRTRISITWVCPSLGPVAPEYPQLERESEQTDYQTGLVT